MKEDNVVEYVLYFLFSNESKCCLLFNYNHYIL